VVAIGAAIQGGVLGGEMKEVVLLDVTPLTLGIETLGGVATPLIVRNTTVPTAKSETFTTAADNQTSVEIHVLQGERPMATDNKSLGRFILDGLPPAPRGIPQIEVSFDIDANGILNVTAKDKATSKTQSIKITGSTGLTKDEVETMTKTAEEHAEEDLKKREEIEARNKVDNLVYTAEKTLKDESSKVPEDLKKEVEEKIASLKSIIETGTKEDLEAKSKDLSDSLAKIGQHLYQQSQQTQNEKAEEGKETKSEKTEDVEEGEVVGD
jgi:molecular chaperone DnaK